MGGSLGVRNYTGMQGGLEAGGWELPRAAHFPPSLWTECFSSRLQKVQDALSQLRPVCLVMQGAAGPLPKASVASLPP